MNWLFCDDLVAEAFWSDLLWEASVSRMVSLFSYQLKYFLNMVTLSMSYVAVITWSIYASW